MVHCFGTKSEKSYTMEFRAYKDDAWYSVSVLLGGETLTVKYLNFSDEHDNAFEASQFGDRKQLEDFEERFRPLSRQLQDSECRLLAEGVRVCACRCFGEDELRFYDAVVDGVQKSEHSWKAGGELCLCTFILFWLHGPNAKNLTVTTIENICIVQPERKLDPVVASFLEMAREKIELLSPCSVSASKGGSHLEMVSYWNESSNTTRGIGYFEQIEKEKRCARQSVVNVGSPEVSCHDMEDRDLEGTKNVCMILIANIDRELCPSTVTEFLHRHTSVSASVFIFPSLSSEVYTRGAIMLDSEKEFQELCDFLNNPNCIITSSTGRPWVILEKQVGLKKLKHQ
ncbi:disease resistance protein RPM [Spatholobus suberectus]|nr:disease resistance protein RPM [Spatholobus suberectus]